MELYPAIDVRGGRCVRLLRGDYAAETVYDDDPVAVAQRFAAAGARWIHVVDLDAARTGEPLNHAVIAAVARAVTAEGMAGAGMAGAGMSRSGMSGPGMAGAGAAVEAGWGVRSEAAAVALWEAGVRRVVLGTAAVEDPDLVARLAAGHPGGVAVGVDTRGGEVAVRGWREAGGMSATEVLARLEGTGVAAVIVTDIGRDGMLGGPDTTGLEAVLDATGIDVVASGGVAGTADLVALGALRGPRSGRRLAGAIVGKALYEGRLTVAEGVAACAASV